MFQPDLSAILRESYAATFQLRIVMLVWKGNKWFVEMYSFQMQVTENRNLKYRS